VAIAVWAGQEGVNLPYVTVAETKTNVATSAVDFTKLVKGGSSDDQLLVLTDMIALACEKVDDYCLDAMGTMSATINTEVGEHDIDGEGLIAVKPEYWPVLGVNSFSYGRTPSNLQVVPVTNQTCWIDKSSFKVSQGLGGGLSIGSLSQVLGGGLGIRGTHVFCQYSYTNGFFNALLAEPATAGDTQVVLNNVIGLVVAMQKPLPIYDGLSLENCVIDGATWDGLSTTVPLLTPLQFDHAVGVRFSAIPRIMTQAAIHFVVGQMKERGVGGFTLQERGESKSKASSGDGDRRMEDAHGYDLLDSLRKYWGRG
jgi:hypothetical protein